MSQPNIAIACIENLWSRQMHFSKAGDVELEHDHSFDHLTLLATGSLEVTVDGKKSVFKAPQMIYIKARKLHTLVALEDNTLAYCIHALRDKTGECLLDPSMIPAGVTPTDVAASLTV